MSLLLPRSNKHTTRKHQYSCLAATGIATRKRRNSCHALASTTTQKCVITLAATAAANAVRDIVTAVTTNGTREGTVVTVAQLCKPIPFTRECHYLCLAVTSFLECHYHSRVALPLPRCGNSNQCSVITTRGCHYPCLAVATVTSIVSLPLKGVIIMTFTMISQ